MPSAPPASTEPARPARRARRKQARPGELLDAALDLFVEKGFAATRVEEVAARAGVSKGTLFLYFSSKEELFKAVVRENITGRFAEWNQELESFPGTCSEMLGYCLRSWWERIGATRAGGISKLMIGEAGNFPEVATFYQQEVMAPGQALIRRVLQRGVELGEFRVPDLDMAVFALVAPMMFLMMNRHSLGACGPIGVPLDPARFLDAQVALLLDGFRIRPATAKDKP